MSYFVPIKNMLLMQVMFVNKVVLLERHGHWCGGAGGAQSYCLPKLRSGPGVYSPVVFHRATVENTYT